MPRTADADAFSAIADPTRRAILELLHERDDLNAGQIAAEFPTISRAAVSKHLGVLRRADLVRPQQDGREWHYTLNTQPLVEVYAGWLRTFEDVAEASLRELKRRAEDEG